MSGNQNAIARDHNLLFGVIAVQLHFISPADLARAAAVWATEPDQDLGNILEGMGLLNDDKRSVINQLLELKVEDHGGDPSATLASMGGDRAVHESFAASIAISDEKIAASLQSFGGHAHDVPEHEAPAAGPSARCWWRLTNTSAGRSP